jgi:hypothetical protein
VNFPDAQIVSDIICDPQVLTAEDSRSLVWHKVLAPLFQGNDQNNAKLLQLLSGYSKFARERPTSAFASETSRREALMEALTNDRNIGISRHWAFAPSDSSISTAQLATADCRYASEFSLGLDFCF